MPTHIAIIPDGNRRWAKENGKKPSYGHYVSAKYEKFLSLFNEAKRLKVKYISIWVFSTDNWNRSKLEVKYLFDLLKQNIKSFSKDCIKNKIRFTHVGRKDRLPKVLMNSITKLEEETKEFTEFNVQICMDYGGRDEILRAANKAKWSGKPISEKAFMECLDTAGVPDVDLIIRTSGEQRLSGFMPFQSVYAELYFTKIHFPEFGPTHLKKAIMDFRRRQRRYGGG